MNKAKTLYTIWEQTPLKWHKFATYFGIPVGILMTIARIPGYLNTMSELTGTGFEWLCIVDILYALVMISVSSAAFIGNLARFRMWYGPCCLISSYLVSIVYCLFCFGVSAWFGTLAQDCATLVGQLIALVIVIFLLRIYYRKRRLLFRPAPFQTLEKGNSTQEPVNPPPPILQDSVDAPLNATEESSVDLLMRVQAEQQSHAEEHIQSPDIQMKRARNQAAAPVWLTAALGCGCVVLAAVCIVLGLQGSQLREENLALEGNYSELSQEYDSLKKVRDALRQERDELKEEVEQLNEQYGEDYFDALARSNFLLWRIGFVVDGSKYYHTCDCQIFQDADTFWAHNTEYCEYLGYSECPLCH